MAWRYRRRLSLFPGFAVNLGKRGLTSVSVGSRGVHSTFGRRGPRTTVGLPGTGISYTTASPYHRRRRARARHGSIVGGLIGLFVLYVLFRALAGL
jgi:hypothetical protein